MLRVMFCLLLSCLLIGCSGQPQGKILPTIPLVFQSLADQPTQSAPPVVSPQSEPTIDANAYQNDVLREHRIAYVIADGAVDNSYVLAPEGLEAGWGAVIIHDWETFLEENGKEPFEAVIIHRSALPFVDYSWVTAAYRNAVVIALIDIYYPQLPELLGFCDRTPPPEPWYARNFYRVYDMHYGPVTQQGYERIQEGLARCQSLSELRVSGGSGYGGESLDGPYGLRFFAGSLQSRLMGDVQRPVVIIPTSNPDITPDR
jgi:hypothetical protein